MTNRKLEKLYEQRKALSELISAEQYKILYKENMKYLGRFYKKRYSEQDTPAWYLYSYVTGVTDFGDMWGVQFSSAPDKLLSIQRADLDSWILEVEIGEKEFIAAYVEFLREVNSFSEEFPFDIARRK